MSSQLFVGVLRRRRGNSLHLSVLMADRLVRFLPQFFDELDLQLPDQRGAGGAPSAADFLLYDLPSMRDRLATAFELNTLAIIGADSIRVLIGSGTLVRAVAIYAYVDDDDYVAVIGIDIESATD